MLREIRKYFNVQLMSIAKYTGFSVSYMKALSVDKRSYNITVLNKLMPLYKALSLTKKVDDLFYYKDILKEEEEVLNVQLKKLIKKINIEIEHKEKSLNDIQQKREDALRGLHACKSLLQNKKKRFIGRRYSMD